jgi:hypothetical protein
LDVTPYQHHGNQAVEYLVAVDVVNHQEPLKHLATKSLPSTSTPLLRRNQCRRIGNTSGSNVRLITPQGTLTEVSSVGAGLRAQRLESAERCVADATSLKKPIVDQPSALASIFDVQRVPSSGSRHEQAADFDLDHLDGARVAPTLQRSCFVKLQLGPGLSLLLAHFWR